MSLELPVPETRVLAIASHVVYGYVGNTMATFVMQSLGCEVAALNTVHFSNHTGYRQFKGTRASAYEILDIYEGLKQSYLTDFDVLLSGYAPSKEVVEAVGAIARDLRFKSSNEPGSFFWVLDPVMGDQGRLYVNENVVPAYKGILREADLILPNQFETETLSGVTISTPTSVANAISTLHKTYRIPHIIVTSIRFPASEPKDETMMTVIGSTATSDLRPRLFSVSIPYLPCFFSGTGDMFAALTVCRFREAATKAKLLNTTSWQSPDDVTAENLPLAKAVEKVLSSMQMVLEKTVEARDQELEANGWGEKERSNAAGVEASRGGDGQDKREYLARTKAGEVRVVRNRQALIAPEIRYKAKRFESAVLE